MRAVHKTAAIVAVLGIAFGVTACDPDTKSSQSGMTKSVDESLKTDLSNLATVLEGFQLDHGTEYSTEVAPTEPGGSIDFGSGDTFKASPGNVIAVKVIEKGYCISGYNKLATKATSGTKALLYNSNKGGPQPGVGAC